MSTQRRSTRKTASSNGPPRVPLEDRRSATRPTQLVAGLCRSELRCVALHCAVLHCIALRCNCNGLRRRASCVRCVLCSIGSNGASASALAPASDESPPPTHAPPARTTLQRAAPGRDVRDCVATRRAKCAQQGKALLRYVVSCRHRHESRCSIRAAMHRAPRHVTSAMHAACRACAQHVP